MTTAERLHNHVKSYRLARGWSQAELAQQAGISRAAVSAVETERLVPSVAAALSLAHALGCRVESLFSDGLPAVAPATWAWPPGSEPSRYWHAEVNGRVLYYPVETGVTGALAHDGVCRRGTFESRNAFSPAQTLVVATCDPAAAFLAAELARTTAFRLLVIPRSSSAALQLLGQGLVHAAGMHLARAGARDGNAGAVRQALGTGYQLLHVARWQAGLALASGVDSDSVGGVLRRRKLRWIGREAGSGARQCQEELLTTRAQPRFQARDHRGVAEAIRCGWADVGVCVRLVSEEAGLGFLSVRDEAYDICVPTAAVSEPRVAALMQTIQSDSYRRLLGELPGYDPRDAGLIREV